MYLSMLQTGIIRDDASTVSDNTEVSSLEQRSGERVKQSVVSVIGKACIALVRSVNLSILSKVDRSSSSSDSDFELDANGLEEEEGIDGLSPDYFKLLSPNKVYVDFQLVAAGWPSWLVGVAREALVGWVPRRHDSYVKLGPIGEGKCYHKGRDMLNGKLVVLKKVQFDSYNPESVKYMAREILILRRLDHPNVIKLDALVMSKKSSSLYLVFDYMENDLASLATNTGTKLTEAQIKCYMRQLLLGLEHCHNRCILHRDIKSSHLLLDNGGVLKIAGFGSASFFDPYQKQPMTGLVGSLWYRAPELLLGTTVYGEAVDLWSTGCVLAELFAGKPIMPGRTEVEQLHNIFKLCGTPPEKYWKSSKLPHVSLSMPLQSYRRCIPVVFHDFPQSALSLIETLLAIDPTERKTATAALKSEFLTAKSYASEPLSFPKYPPIRNVEVKLHVEEAKRLHSVAGRTNIDDVKKTPTCPRAVMEINVHESKVHVEANFGDSLLTKSTGDQSRSSYQEGLFAAPLHSSGQEPSSAPEYTCKEGLTSAWFTPLWDTVAIDSPRLKKNKASNCKGNYNSRNQWGDSSQFWTPAVSMRGSGKFKTVQVQPPTFNTTRFAGSSVTSRSLEESKAVCGNSKLKKVKELEVEVNAVRTVLDETKEDLAGKTIEIEYFREEAETLQHTVIGMMASDELSNYYMKRCNILQEENNKQKNKNASLKERVKKSQMKVKQMEAKVAELMMKLETEPKLEQREDDTEAARVSPSHTPTLLLSEPKLNCPSI